MAITTWDEIRTAYHVARVGTVSGAADVLGVHHATVIRHIDSLEGQLGVKLFQRHARGYTPTEAGADLLQVAQATDDQFTQLAGRIRGQGASVSGELVVTSLPMLSAQLTPALVEFQAAHPGLLIRSLTDARLFRLEYGEAHVAVRAGSVPREPDNVAQRFGTLRFGLYASAGYIRENGLPSTDGELAHHRFVSHDDEAVPAPFYRWLRETVPPDRIVFRGTDDRVLSDAVRAGAGIGFFSTLAARAFDDLREVRAPRDEWEAALWLVTHVDLHRTTKVQAFLKFLKARAADWPDFAPR